MFCGLFDDAIGRSNELISWLIIFFLFQAINRVFRALDRLSCLSGSVFMPKKFEIFQEFREEFAGISIINLRYFGHNFGTRNPVKTCIIA